jgi:hypothetical protein
MISVVLTELGLHLIIATLGEVVIFYDIKGFQGRCFLLINVSVPG